MKFSIQSSALQKSVQLVEKAISSRTSLEVLENLFLQLEGNRLRLRGNDLEIGIENSVEVQDASGDGTILVKAKTFASIIAKIQNQNLTIEVKDQSKMLIQTPTVNFDILCNKSDEYPVFPSIESGTILELPVATLTDLIRYTLFAVSFDETKQFLNGILVKIEGSNLTFVSTDGYRLSLKTAQIQSETPLSVIVPYKAMSELQKIIQGLSADDVIKMTVSENQAAFHTSEFILVSRVIKGQFPDYNQVLPKATENKYQIQRRLFLDAFERASIIAQESNNVIRLTFGNENVNVKASAPATGEFKEDLNIKRLEGQGETKIAFNVKLVIEAIKIMVSDDISVEFNGGLNPCIVRPLNDESFTYIIMPIRTSDFQPETQEAEKEAETVQ